MACIRKTTKGLYQVDFRIGNVRKRQSFSTKKEAKDFSRQLEPEIIRRLLPNGGAKSLWLHDAVTKYREAVSAKKSPDTQEIEELIFREFLGYFQSVRLADLTARHMETWQTVLSQRLKPQSVNRYFTCVRHFFNKCVAWEFLNKNPCFGLKSLKDSCEKVPRVLSPQEVTLLMKEANPQIADVIFLLARVGLRRKEIVSLRWQAVDFERRVFHIEASEGFHPKGYRPRTIPMSEEILQFFKRKQCEAQEMRKASKDDRVFLNTQNEPILPDRLTKAFVRLGRRIGMKNLGPHQLRHSFCTHLVGMNQSLEKVRLLAGHKDIETTARYLHLVPDELREALEKLSVFHQEKLG